MDLNINFGFFLNFFEIYILQNAHTQKAENPNPDLNLWAFSVHQSTTPCQMSIFIF